MFFEDRTASLKIYLLRTLRPVIRPIYRLLAGFIRAHKDSTFAPLILMTPYLIFMTIFFIIPVAYILVISFYTNIPAGTMERSLTLENYIQFFNSTLYVNTLYTTVEISILTTIVTVFVSYPIAYFIVFSKWRYAGILILLVIAPMLVGNVVRAFGWFALLDTSGLVNQFLSILGLEYRLLRTKPGLVIAISSVLMPFAILIMLSNLYSIDKDLIEAGNNLGGNSIQTFSYITLPLSMPGIIGATLICFVLTMGTFATAVFVGMPQVPMIAPIIYNVTTSDLNWPLGAAMSFILLIVSLILIYIYGKVMNIGNERQTARINTFDGKSAQLGRERRFPLSGVLGRLSFDNKLFGNLTIAGLAIKSSLSFLYLFLLIPVIFAVMISVSEGLYIFPPERPTMEWYISVIESRRWINSFMVSFQYTIPATVLALILSFFAAFAIGRFEFPFKDSLTSATFLPLIVPQVILGLALLIYLHRFGLVGSITALTIGVAVYATPFAIQTLLIAMNNFNYRLEEAAQSLGADEIQTFFKITLPGLLPGIISAAILAFIISFANLTIVVFVQGPGTVPVTVRIFSSMQHGATPVIAAVATINIIITLLAIIFLERVFGAAEAMGYSSESIG